MSIDCCADIFQAMEGQYTSVNDTNMPISISAMNSYETQNVIMDLNFVEENLGRDWWYQDKEETKHSLRKERNKIAARKCRQKKLDKLNNLGRKLSNLKEDIEAGSTFIKTLQASIYTLKEEIIEHNDNGCQIGVNSDNIQHTKY